MPGDFVLGVKINSSDYVKSSPGNETGPVPQEQRALEHIQKMASWNSLDFIEISGGDYENPGSSKTLRDHCLLIHSFIAADFMSQSALDSSPRQALFSRFSCCAMETIASSSAIVNKDHTPPRVLLTGGLRSSSHLNGALQHGHADLLGIGRGAITCPDLPDKVANDVEGNVLTRSFAREPDFASEPNLRSKIDQLIKSFMFRIQLVGAGATMAWYILMIRRLVQSSNDGTGVPQMEYSMGALEAVLGMWIPIQWHWTQWRIQTIIAVLGILAACMWSWSTL